MHHVQGGTPLSITVCLRQVALNNQTVPVLHQRMAHEAQCRASAGRFFVEPCLRGPWVDAWVAFERFSPLKSTSALRLR